MNRTQLASSINEYVVLRDKIAALAFEAQKISDAIKKDLADRPKKQFVVDGDFKAQLVRIKKHTVVIPTHNQLRVTELL